MNNWQTKIDECANKTDIWDNERWKPTRKLLIGEMQKLHEQELEEFAKEIKSFFHKSNLFRERIDKLLAERLGKC